MDHRKETRAIVGLTSCVVTIIVFTAIGRGAGLFGRSPTESSRTVNARGAAIGSLVSLPRKAIGGKRIEKKPTLIVALGGCSSCASRKTDYDAIADLGWPQTILVFESSTQEVLSDKRLQSSTGSMLVIADSSAQLSDQLNVLWTPRWYVLNPSSVIESLQLDRTQKAPVYSGEAVVR